MTLIIFLLIATIVIGALVGAGLMAWFIVNTLINKL